MTHHVPLQSWSTDLSDCFDDLDSCCLTLFCPCISFGRIAHIVDKGQTSVGRSAALWCVCLCFFIEFQWLYTCCYRSDLRKQFNIEETPCCDCCVELFCGWCSLCQMYRELKNRGFHMDSGYVANIERMNARRMQPPPVHRGMRK
ncbi:hypothetical protein LUZ60_000185 [Juncus effusus]|nr:hypothetical protein LUZ60_000185 [Juncus effusus]